jgi:iron-sulfur cluster assembly protein
LTPDAVERLKQIQSQDGKLIKISVVAKGCAGGAYRLDYLTPPAGKFDEVVEQDGVTVVVDSRSLMKVIGSVMDFRDDVLASRFVFENPNVVSTCGCEESFATKEDEDRILGTGGKV